jgi:hypothetical protein
MEKEKGNFKLGIITVILGYFTFAFYLITIFAAINFMKADLMIYSYVMAGFLLLFVLASGIFFLVSIIFNIKKAQTDHKMTKGLILTLTGMPPIVLVYLALLIKVLTENH